MSHSSPMSRRRLLALGGAAAAGLTLLPGRAAAADRPPTPARRGACRCPARRSTRTGCPATCLRVSRGAYSWESFMHHRRKVDLGDQRHFWGSVFDNAVVGRTQKYQFHPFSDAPTVASVSKEVLPAVNIEASGYQNPFTAWKATGWYDYYV